MKLLRAALTATALVLALSGAAHADQRHARTTIVFAPADLTFVEPTAACPTRATFGLVALGGSSIGSGTSCIQDFQSECPVAPFVGCRETIKTDLTLELQKGSLVFSSTLREVFIRPDTVFQVVTGTLTDATGAYAGRSGTLLGTGTIAFTATGTAFKGVWAAVLSR
jgi:hypothetical protein